MHVHKNDVRVHAPYVRLHEDKLEVVKTLDGTWDRCHWQRELAGSVMVVVEKLRLGESTRSYIWGDSGSKDWCYGEARSERWTGLDEYARCKRADYFNSGNVARGFCAMW